MTRTLTRAPFGPFDALLRLQGELDDVFERPFGWFSSGLSGRGAFPPVNVFRGEHGYVIRLELPGLAPDELSIEAQMDALRVSGKRNAESAVGTPHRLERWSGDFDRSIQLPADADPANAKATYKHGVLHIDVPLREEARPRKIEVGQ